MRLTVRALVLLIIVALIAGGACWLTARHLERQTRNQVVEAHPWIHSQLHITPEQDKALIPIEQRYSEKKKHYAELLRIANQELAQSILADQKDSNRVTAAVAQIHSAQGELQNATLQHIFEMRSVLTPEQYDHLLKMTAEALSKTEHGR